MKPFEGAIVLLHDSLKSLGIDEAYGPAIIMFTVLLKALTFPLNLPLEAQAGSESRAMWEPPLVLSVPAPPPQSTSIAIPRVVTQTERWMHSSI